MCLFGAGYKLECQIQSGKCFHVTCVLTWFFIKKVSHLKKTKQVVVLTNMLKFMYTNRITALFSSV